MEESNEHAYSWLVLAASFWMQCLMGFILESGGAFHTLFLEAFDRGSEETSVIASLNQCLIYVLGMY
jgi:hypothetical protein